MLFVDYMNAREAAGRLYAEPYAERYPDRNPPTGDFYPRELGQVICDEYNKHRRRPGEPSLKLAEVRVYCGVHDRDRDNPKHIDRLERMRTWTDLPERDAIVNVFPSPIQYSHGWYASEQDRKASVEKEVDTAIAADMVAMALDGQFDVAIVFSGDRDMWPPVYAVSDLTAPGRTIGVYCFGWAYRKDKRVLKIPDGREIPNDADFRQEPLWLKHYIACADDTNYLRRRLQDYPKGAIVTGKVIRQLKTGGLVVAIDHDVLGVLPKGELADNVGNGHLGDYVNQELTVAIKLIVDDPSQLDHGDLPVILSERVAVRAKQKDRLFDELREGEIREGRITGIQPFGVFVDLGGADGLAHRSELSWERDVDPETMFTIGQEVNVFITKIDKESEKISLSIRRVAPEQWDEAVTGFKVGQIVPSVVTKLVPFGAFARIEGSVEGLVHISELADRRITHPREVVTENDVIPVKIVRIERDRRRLGLSLRQARTDAERAGWMFDEAGRIARLPDELAAELGVEQG